MSFLPSTYEKIPTTSNYMKFQDGDNNFRVLSSAVVGFEYWTTDNKPVRAKEPWNTIPDDIKFDEDGNFRVNHFWAFAVYNYDEKRIQILEITQKKVMKAIKALVDNPKWGDPKGYDISVTRSGKGFETDYVTMPSPHSVLSPEIEQLYKNVTINLEALFESTDPFLPPVAADIVEAAAQLQAESGYEKAKAVAEGLPQS
jgi:hypothetical protein